MSNRTLPVVAGDGSNASEARRESSCIISDSLTMLSLEPKGEGDSEQENEESLASSLMTNTAENVSTSSMLSRDNSSSVIVSQRSVKSSNLMSSSVTESAHSGEVGEDGSVPSSMVDSDKNLDTEIEERLEEKTTLSQEDEECDNSLNPSIGSSPCSMQNVVAGTAGETTKKKKQPGKNATGGKNCANGCLEDPSLSASTPHQSWATSATLPVGEAAQASINETDNVASKKIKSHKEQGRPCEYDGRVAEKRRQIVEQATSTCSATSHSADQALELNSVGAVAAMPSETAPGDELAAATMMERNHDSLKGGMDNNDECIKKEEQVDPNEDEKRRLTTGSQPSAENEESFSDEDSDEEVSRPGAYQVPGRAFGTFPVWGRNDAPQCNEANDGMMTDTLDDCPETSELNNDIPHTTMSGSKVFATALDESEFEERVRQDMMRNAVQAEMVTTSNSDDDEYKIKKRHIFVCLAVALLLILVIIGLSVGFSVAKRNDDKSSSEGSDEWGYNSLYPSSTPTVSPTYDPTPTLELVKESGVLSCGVDNIAGFAAKKNQTDEMEGFEVDLCRAIAAAVFGSNGANRSKYKVVLGDDRFLALTNRTIDVLFSATTHTMERDIYQAAAETGFSFSVPYLYDGLQFAGIPPFGACANNLSSYFGDCRLLLVCVKKETSHVPVVGSLLPPRSIYVCDNVVDDFIHGPCNAIAGEKFTIAESQIRKHGYNGPYETGQELFSKEPLAIVTRDGDAQWSDFVNWVLQALLAAEERNITRDTATRFSNTSVFGDEFSGMFVHAISAVGNYQEIYERHLEAIVPRQNVDKINTNGMTGLLYSLPFGNHNSTGPEPVERSTLKLLTMRKELRCGVFERPGFAVLNTTTEQWQGLDVDYCRALASGIVNGTEGRVTLVNITSEQEPFALLANEEVDVLVGINVDIFSDVKGVSFSQPYFYDPPLGVVDKSLLNQTRAVATRQTDPQWSAYVYWIVSSTFYAEENYIYQNNSMAMPLVQLFGPTYQNMFRNAIAAVGNSKEIYERNIQSFFAPRSGRNQPNRIPFGPQHCTLPGI